MPSAILKGFDDAEVTTPTIAGWIAQYGEPSEEVMNLVKLALLLKNTPDPE